MYLASNTSHIVTNEKKNILFALLAQKKQTLSVRCGCHNPSTVVIILHSRKTSRQQTKSFYLFYSFSLRPGQQNTASFQHVMYKDLPIKYRLHPWHICPADGAHDSEQSS